MVLALALSFRAPRAGSDPRRALWSRNEPVSVLGAARNAYGQQEIDDLFTALGNSFSRCTSYAFDLQACDVAGDMAYTAGLEHTSVSVDGQPRPYTLRATQVYRRESGEWRVPTAMVTRQPEDDLRPSHGRVFRGK
jgi:ketosteroid isomerase-like protein